MTDSSSKTPFKKIICKKSVPLTKGVRKTLEPIVEKGTSQAQVSEKQVDEVTPVPVKIVVKSFLPTIMTEQESFLGIISESFNIYERTGANSRSNEKVKYLQDGIMNIMKNTLKKLLLDSVYQVKTEQNIKSINDTGEKKCDIIIYWGHEPVAIFPVKFIMSNYSQNKNNYFENLTGELYHLKWANPELKICPINIISSVVPYKKYNGIITKFEQVCHKMDIYAELVHHGLCSEMINYIINVKYQCQVGDKYKAPIIEGMSGYVEFSVIFKKLDL